MSEEMGKAMLNEEIAGKRREMAPRLKVVAGKCDEYLLRLKELNEAKRTLDGQAIPQLEKHIEKLQELQGRAELRYRRFENGMITVAVAGLEKAGKTTLLKTLTGIVELPNEDERCTAATCEIRYDDRVKDGSFDIEFYKEDEFCKNVLKPLIEQINKEARDLESDVPIIPTPSNIFEFKNLHVHSDNPFKIGNTGASGVPLWADLKALYDHSDTIKSKLGGHPLTNQPLTELPKWVARATGKENASRLANTATVKRCIIRKSFVGGSINLRLMDTPGFDDPNPRAQEQALSTVAEDADLVATLIRPLTNPTPTIIFKNFWHELQKLRDEIGLTDRLLFFQNQDKRTDPDGKYIIKHRDELTNSPQYNIPTNMIIGPIDVVSEDGAAEFMRRCMQHFTDNLAIQDLKVIEKIEGELKSIEAQMRTQIYDPLDKNTPVDMDLHRDRQVEFEMVFPDIWKQIKTSFHNAIATPVADTTQQGKLNDILRQAGESIKADFPTIEDLKRIRTEEPGDSPTNTWMKNELCYKLTKLVNDLSNSVRDFGPEIQNSICDTLEKAGLARLMRGSTAEEKMKHFQGLLSDVEKRYNRGGDFGALFQNLIDLPDRLQYVYRFEMRDAVSLCDPSLWPAEDVNGGAKAPQCIERIFKSYRPDEAPTYLAKLPQRLPSSDAKLEEHRDFLNEIAKFALSAIKLVIESPHCRLERVSNDILSETRLHLCLFKNAESQWRIFLGEDNVIEALYPEKFRDANEKSQKIADFRKALTAFEMNISRPVGQ
jgi:GTPase SAR1 family protein